MFSFFEKNEKQAGLKKIKLLKLEYLEILTKISEILKVSGHHAQKEVMQQLIALLKNDHFHKFQKRINSTDMWGGAGAVWEVHFDDENKSQNFEREMISLINLMEKTGILGSGIKPIRKIFKKNIGL